MTLHAPQLAQASEPQPALGVSALQRACTCGSAAGVSGNCPSCAAQESLGVQAKLTINPPNDSYEQEADRIADQVISWSAPVTGGPLSVSRLVQRQADPEEEVQSIPATMQRQATEEEEDRLQTRRDNGRSSPETPGRGFSSALAAEAVCGAPLSLSSRAFFEPRFGRDLSAVRVHTSPRAAMLARRINARAFTYGSHIYFGASQLDTTSNQGRRLIAHELTHTLQQTGRRSTQRLQRRNIFEEFAGLFRSDDIGEDELREYLKLLTTARRIEDYTDSDNKARAVVNRLRRGEDLLGFDDTPALRVLLIREMQSGYTGGPDERAILYLLEHASEQQLNEMFAPAALTVSSLQSDFQGAEHRRLDRFFEMRFEGGKAAVSRGEIRAMPRRSPQESMVVYRARVRLARLQKLLARAIAVEAQRTRTLQDRRDLDRNSADIAGPFREAEERRLGAAMNQQPLRVELSERRVVFRINFHVRFEDPATRGRLSDLENSIRQGIQTVWNHRLTDETFGGRDFSIIPVIQEVSLNTPRDAGFWLITVRPTDQSPATFPGCTFPSLPQTPTSATLADCADGVISIPPLHISRPGVLGHEMLHLFGLVDRYRLMEFHDASGRLTGHRLDALRHTPGRSDPLGGESGTILEEDLNYIFNNLGLYEQEILLQTGGLSINAIRAQIAREEEIIRLGRDPRSLIRPRENFNDRFERMTEDI